MEKNTKGTTLLAFAIQ